MKMKTEPARPEAATAEGGDSRAVDSGAEDRGFTWLQRLQISCISRLGWTLIWLIGWTIRFRVENWQAYQSARDAGTPVILSFWHNQIFAATFFWRFRRIVVITSRHFDGEYIARVIRLFGYGTARGSSSRGAVRAVLELKRHLAEGRDVAFTIDGPRGPVYQVKPGPVWLSRKSGLPILCFHIEPERYWRLSSWDGFRIPKPFTKATVHIGQPLLVPPDGDDKTWTAAYQAEMDRLRKASAREARPQRRRMVAREAAKGGKD